MRTALPSYSSDPFSAKTNEGSETNLRDSSAALFAQAAELAQPLEFELEPATSPAAPGAGTNEAQEKTRSALARAAGATVDGVGGVAGTAWGKVAELAKPVEAGQRLVALDAARILATFGVMWTHVLERQGHGSELTALGRYGTSFYIIAAVFLATRGAVRHPDRSWFAGAAQRARRLLGPFLLWSALYATFYYTRLLPTHDHIDLNKLSVWWGPLAGCARHLWFLPFAFFASGVASAVAPRMRNWSNRRVLLTILAASAFTYWLCYRVLFFALDRFWLIEWHLHRLDRWIDEVPLMVLAMGAAILLTRREGKGQPETSNGSARWRERLQAVAGRMGNTAFVRRTVPVVREKLAPVGVVLAPVMVASHGASARVVTEGRNLAVRHAETLEKARGFFRGVWDVMRKQGAAPWLVVGFVAVQLAYMRGYESIHEATHTQGRFMANAAGLCLLGAFLLARPRQWMAKLAPIGRYTYFAFLLHVFVIDYAFWRLSGLPGYGSVFFGFLSTVGLMVLCVQIGAFVKKVPALRWLSP